MACWRLGGHVNGSLSCSSESDQTTSGLANASDDAPRSSQRQDILEEAKVVSCKEGG
uniref:Uncharacterized protein n=1 Tax=Vitis vinifera TaxID=29760 RepID=F6H4T0_VITVI